MRRGDFRLPKALLIMALCALSARSLVAAQHQDLPATATSPTVSRCTPATVTPGVSIRLDGSHFGSGAEPVFVLFVQEGKTYRVKTSGAGRELLRGAQNYTAEHVILAVPEGLKPGRCQILIEVNGVASTPLMIEIAPTVLPVEIGNPEPLAAQPGETVWVEALGISDSDEVELIDAAGTIRNLDVSSHTAGIRAYFTLPDDLPSGELKFCIVEKRSGLNQRSNSLVLQIDAGPQPLVFYYPEGNVKPLAPGQWLYSAIENTRAAERAERIEVAFTQKEQLIVAASLFNRPNDRLHVQVPPSLFPGRVKIMTRTWLKGRASSWSEPLELELLDHPIAPYLWGISIAKPRGNEQITSFETPGAKVITAQSGDRLMVSGMFLVESLSQLQVTLKGEGQEVKLRLAEAGELATLIVTLPQKLMAGEWSIIISNPDQKVSVTVPVILRIE